MVQKKLFFWDKMLTHIAIKKQTKNLDYQICMLELETFDKIERIRYTTSHPKDMTEDLINVYKNSNKLMPLVHLPVQSGVK